MALVLLNDDGELDRGKVNAELDRLLGLLPIPNTTICRQATASIREGFIALLDAVQDASFDDGFDAAREMGPK